MPSRLKAVLFSVFAVSGFSALTLQVVWQRVISLHAGVDLFSITTVVSAFLAGIGLGSLLGGWLADRLGGRRSLVAFAVANAGIGAFAWISVWLFYDVYRDLVPRISGGMAVSFAFHFALLVVPTTLMGLSLPLLSRGMVDRISEAAPLVGRLYAVNTVGAGVGALASGWLLIGSLGFLTTVRLAGTLNLLAAVLILAVWRQTETLERPGGPAPLPVPPPFPSAVPASPPGEARTGAAWHWFLLYGLTGAVALGLEIVFFRLVDALMRSNSYTFGHVLGLYLLLFGAGAAAGSRLVRRTRRPDRWFLGLQFGVGLAALAGVLVLVEVPSRIGVGGPFESYFSVDGYNIGGYRFDSAKEVGRLLFAHLAGPLLIMAAPVFAMGASFPFVQALVAQRMTTLGRRTGLLLFSNIVGNVAGALVVGFVLFDALGTSGTLRTLAGLLLLPGLAVAWQSTPRARRLALAGGAVAAVTAAIAVFPDNRALWAYFHSAPIDDFTLAEDRACVTSLKDIGEEEVLFINATSQNGYPYDDFHVLIGLLPALLHDRPERAMAVGLGIGATPYGLSRDPRLGRLDVVEICGTQRDLLEGLGREGSFESARLFDDPRVNVQVGDGRKFLLSSNERFDVVTVDVLRPQSAFSGNLYSVEFYELVRSRLAEGGIMAQWVATPRTLNSATAVFPHVMAFTVDSYGGSQFFVASEEPIEFDRERILARLDDISPATAFSPVQAEAITAFLSTIDPVPVQAGGPSRAVAEDQLNRDLAPRDEYFLNNPLAIGSR